MMLEFFFEFCKEIIPSHFYFFLVYKFSKLMNEQYCFNAVARNDPVSCNVLHIFFTVFFVILLLRRVFSITTPIGLLNHLAAVFHEHFTCFAADIIDTPSLLSICNFKRLGLLILPN